VIQAVTILKFQISAYKQHCSWIAEFMKNFITINIWSVLAYDKDHDGDGVVLFFCLLQECSCATWETLVLAAEALHHISLDFQTSLKMSRASLPSVSSTSKSSLESVAKFLILIFDQDSRGSWRVFAEKKMSTNYGLEQNNSKSSLVMVMIRPWCFWSLYTGLLYHTSTCSSICCMF
jgi:hypothetical protein